MLVYSELSSTVFNRTYILLKCVRQCWNTFVNQRSACELQIHTIDLEMTLMWAVLPLSLRGRNPSHINKGLHGSIPLNEGQCSCGQKHSSRAAEQSVFALYKFSGMKRNTHLQCPRLREALGRWMVLGTSQKLNALDYFLKSNILSLLLELQHQGAIQIQVVS